MSIHVLHALSWSRSKTSSFRCESPTNFSSSSMIGGDLRRTFRPARRRFGGLLSSVSRRRRVRSDTAPTVRLRGRRRRRRRRHTHVSRRHRRKSLGSSCKVVASHVNGSAARRALVRPTRNGLECQVEVRCGRSWYGRPGLVRRCVACSDGDRSGRQGELWPSMMWRGDARSGVARGTGWLCRPVPFCEALRNWRVAMNRDDKIRELLNDPNRDARLRDFAAPFTPLLLAGHNTATVSGQAAILNLEVLVQDDEPKLEIHRIALSRSQCTELGEALLRLATLAHQPSKSEH